MATETMTELPGWECYVDYTSKNYGLNALRFTTHAGSFWFSYRTLVAFKFLGKPKVVHENDWGPTTGKHLNTIDRGDKGARVDSATFARLYQQHAGEVSR